jgi:hypothetical protein
MGLLPAPRPERRCGTSSVPARRLRVEWSGTARVSPRRLMIEPINPSVLAQSGPKHGLQRKRHQDRQRRIPRLAAAGCPRCRSPSHDRFLSEPDRQASTLPQARVVGRPIRHLALLLWATEHAKEGVVVAGGVGLERHCRFRISRGPSPYPNPPPTPTADPCSGAPAAANASAQPVAMPCSLAIPTASPRLPRSVAPAALKVIAVLGLTSISISRCKSARRSRRQRDEQSGLDARRTCVDRQNHAPSFRPPMPHAGPRAAHARAKLRRHMTPCVSVGRQPG